MGRWLSRLSELGVTNDRILHRKGTQHTNADALSRRPMRRCPREDCQECCIPELGVTSLKCSEDPDLLKRSHEELRTAQDQDKIIGDIKKRIEEGKPRPLRPEISKESKEARYIYSYWNQLTIRHGVLCRWKKVPGRSRRIPQIVLPMDCRKEVLDWCHGSTLAGHLGLRRSMDLLCQRYWWPGIKKDTQRWIQGCPVCMQAHFGDRSVLPPFCLLIVHIMDYLW